MRIDFDPSPSDETLAAVRAGIRRATEAHVPWEQYVDLAFTARRDDGAQAGAAFGEAGRGWLHVSLVWVEEAARRQGTGSQLLRAIETESIRRGCHSAYLDTFSYQARPFYERHGYHVFGTLEDYPQGHRRFFMSKRLPPG